MTNKIKVLVTVPHLTSSASPYRQMMALAKYLPKDEFELTICSLRKNGFEETGPLLEVLGVPYFFARYRIKNIKKLPDYLQANRLIKEYGPFDIQHSFDFSTLPLETITARLHNRKFVHQQRNLNEEGHFFALWLTIMFSNHVIACSPSVKRFLLGIGIKEKRISVIFNGMEITRDVSEDHINFSLPEKFYSKAKHLPNLVMVSQLVPRKRIEDAIIAVKKLKSVYAGIQLWVVGANYDNDYKQWLIKFIEENCLTEYVQLLGTLDNRDVLHLMSKSNIFLHCAEHEAFGWVILEAFSQKVPVIAAASEGPKDIITDGINGFLYPVGDTEMLASKIESLLRNNDLNNKVVNQAYADLHSRFSAEAMVNQMAEVYRSLLRN